MTWKYKEYYRRKDLLFDIIACTQRGEKDTLTAYYDEYCRIAQNRGVLPDTLPAWIDSLKRVFASRV